jgi:Methyltransferase domain
MQTQSPQVAGDHPTQGPGPIGDRVRNLPRSAARETPTLKRKLKTMGKRGLRRLFEFGQRFGVDLLPHHFYSEVPSIHDLSRDGLWKLPRSMVGVGGAATDVQFEFVESICTPGIVSRLRRDDIYRDACAMNGEPGFGAVDADFLFGFVQSIRPRKIVQIGCGVSTAVMLIAAQELSGYRPEVICVEPYPTAFLKEAHRSGLIRLVEEKAQTVPLETLTDLGEDGFLFVDSTHAVKPGSEVNRLIFEVLPRLNSGAWVHFHDIYFPYDYQRGLLDDELFFSNESALLHAFLINNSEFLIRSCLSMLHYADPARLGQSLPNYRPARNDHGLRASDGHFPGSIYLQSF